MSRAKKLAVNDTHQKVQVLVPAAMSNGRIDDSLLVNEVVSNIKDELFTKTGDVVIKASTPYDCVYIDETHKGLLVTSFGLILRQGTDKTIDMRYLATYLGQKSTNQKLQSISKGISIQLIKKRDLEKLVIPLPPIDEQVRLAQLFESTQRRKELCYAIAKKSDLLLQSEFAKTVKMVD